MQRRKKAATNIHSLLINVNHYHLFHCAVIQYLSQRRSFTPTGDEDCRGARVSDHRRMNQGLMIDELILLTRLHFAIQDQTSAKTGGLNDLHRLELALP